MVSFREFPVKSLPECLLLDLRRRDIRVPPEIQMRIMFYKEVAEARDKKDQAMTIIARLPMCTVFAMPQSVWNKPWLTTGIRLTHCRQMANPSRCHWCRKVFAEMLTIGMRAELGRPTPNLDRLYNESGWMSMELYRQRTSKTRTGEWLCHTYQRPQEMDTLYKILNWTVVTCSIVDLVTDLEAGEDILLRQY